MKYLSYKNNHAFIEKVAIQDVVKEVKTPFYLYSKKVLLENFLEFQNAFKDVDHKICYAIKACGNVNLVKILAQNQSGIDAVSAGEIYRALKAKIDPKKIVFAGVGKTKEEMVFALENGVEEFSVESESEMFALNEVALKMNKKAKFLLRVNPNVDAKTHDKISTGRKGDKFGVDIDFAKEIYQKARNLPGLEIYGISTHIGSQITQVQPFQNAFLKIRELFLELKKDGFDIKSLDFGGGIGINYNGETTIKISDYAKIIKEIVKDLGVKLTIAPGRAIIGNAGLLVTKVIYVKQTVAKNYAIIDAAMNDLARPGLYDSYHEVILETLNNNPKETYDLAGPVCESTDILAKNRELNSLTQGDLILILSAGAYGSSMSNEYNSRPLIPEILVDGDEFKIIRKRPTFDEMLRLEI